MVVTLLSLPALAGPIDFVCADGDPVVGLPGLTVNCVAQPPLDGTYDDVLWLFGDGEIGTGSAVSHTYEDVGQYTVGVALEGWVPDDPEDTEIPTTKRHGLVTVCGEPTPEFTYEGVGGLDVVLLNRTPPEPRCISRIQWDLYEGRSQGGQALMTFETWDPRLTLPDKGVYTVVLTVGGLAGTNAAALEIDARYGLPDELVDGPLPFAGCDTSGPGRWGTVAWAPLVLLAARRRRR
ncbi:MAG: PKD domain-containing protein [Alphaproteobacteria bacterium]|nr:PKD domain-containing protein [Alphaproteobacteria bacterium]